MSQTFLGRFMHAGSRNMGQGVWDRARAAGYSPKQIAVASRKEEAAGGRVGGAFNTLRVKGAIAARSKPNNWVHNYAGGSGAVGISGLKAALADGRSVDQMVNAASGLHIKDDWGVSGFGRDASQMILNQRQADYQEEEDTRYADLEASFERQLQAAQSQYASMLANRPKPQSTFSQGSSTNPASAGLQISQSPTADSGGVDALKRPRKRPQESMTVLPGNQVNVGAQSG